MTRSSRAEVQRALRIARENSKRTFASVVAMRAEPIPPVWQTDSVQFCWIFIRSDAAADELRYSIRSVQKNFQGTPHITLIGDRPDWYTGHFIPKKQVVHRHRRQYYDSLSKLQSLSTHGETKDKFIWMMDDIYFIRPVTLPDLEVPRIDTKDVIVTNDWRRIKKQTEVVLTEQGHTKHDYATHLPHVVDKDKLQELFNRFDFEKEMLLWETLYGNLFRSNPVEYFPFFHRVLTRNRLNQLQAIEASVVNNSTTAWNNEFHNWLKSLFPDKSSVES